MDSLLRLRLYTLLLLIAVGIMTARVFNVEIQYEPSVYKFNPGRKWPVERPEPRPTFGSNDRARWATVRALVEEGTFVIGRRIADETQPKGYRDEGILFQDGFKSIDVVLHPDRQEFYGTKPPLFTVAVAGEYWLLSKYLKWDVRVQQWEVVATTLLLFNVLPLALSLWLIAKLIEAYGTTDWGRLFAFACACFGTLLPTFVITLNNHVPAACCVAFALYAMAKPLPTRKAEEGSEGTPTVRWSIPRLLVAGFFSASAACLDLPALAFSGAIAFVLLLKQPKGLLVFLPAFLLPIAAQTYINFLAIGTWEPIYAKFGGPWYEYAGSHWAKKSDPAPFKGIDFADEPKGVYAVNLLVGHHGLFSLTPIWLLSLVGMAYARTVPSGIRILWMLVPPVAIVVIGFYIPMTNNYGGWTSGPRWLFWLTPLFLWTLIPIADRISTAKWSRGLGMLFLGVSAFSAAYPSINPWRHPWIFQIGEYMGWIRY
jgi:hypothetical protein